jgi:tRNA(Ile)-lysidine synthase
MPTAKDTNPQQKVLSFIRKNRLLSAGDKVVVAVSGGPDSVCLLHLLAGLRKELNISLYIAHLNHQLRGAESDADAKYVAGLARRLKIPATIESRDVREFRKKQHISLEEAAREARYGFLASVVQKTGAKSVSVGHTANDHAETILMHLIRGSGTRGLRGLLPATRQQISGFSLNIIRPLLELNRGDTVAYCRDNNLKPRTDSSNLSLEPFRNKVRQKLLPELGKYNPQIGEALMRTARNAAADFDFIETEAQRAASTVTTLEKDAVSIKKQAFLTLHPALQRQILRFSIESLLGSLKDIESGHIEDIIDALEKPAGKVISLPFGLNFYIDYENYIMAKDTASLCPFPALENEFTLKIPGKTASSGWVIEASIVPASTTLITGGEGDGFSACFDAVAAGKHLTVRHSLPGDRFQPLGMAQEKKVNRFMIDAKIPQAWRSSIPIVCAGGHILWVAGWRIGARFRVKPTTQKVLKLDFRRS